MAMVHTFSLSDNEAVKIKVQDDILRSHLERFLAVDTFWGEPDKTHQKGLTIADTPTFHQKVLMLSLTLLKA